MSFARIASKENSIFKTVRLVALQARRAPPDLVVIEGVRMLEEAVATGHAAEAILISEQFGETAREKALLAAWASNNWKVYQVTEALLKSLSSVLAPQGALALVRVPVAKLASAPAVSNPLVLCACGIQDPGNLGTLIRTAVAASASMVCTTPGTVASRNPKTIRASAGALFRIPVIEHVPPVELLEYFEGHSIQAYRASPSEGVPYHRVNFRTPSAILLGNEGEGLKPTAWPHIPSIHIPMAAGVESLNVAATGAILLFEAYQQRRSESTQAHT